MCRIAQKEPKKNTPVISTLGVGVDSGSGTTFHTCFTEETIMSHFSSGNRKASLDAQWSSNSKKTKQSLNVNSSVSADYGLFNSSISVGFGNIQVNEGFTKNYYLTFSYEGGTHDYVLTAAKAENACRPEFNACVKAGDIASFQKLYGNQYVSSTSEGVRFLATLQIHFNSYGSAKTFNTSVKAGGGIGVFSAEVATKMESDSQAKTCNATIQLHVEQFGGEPENIAMVVGKKPEPNQNKATSRTDISNIKTFFNEIETNLNNYIKSIPDQVKGPDGAKNLYVIKCAVNDYPPGLFGNPYGKVSNDTLKALTDLYFNEANNITLMNAIYNASKNKKFSTHLLPSKIYIDAARNTSDDFISMISGYVATGFHAKDDAEVNSIANNLKQKIKEYSVNVPGGSPVLMCKVLEFVQLIHQKGLFMYIGESYDAAILQSPVAFYNQQSSCSEIWEANSKWFDLNLSDATKMINSNNLPIICPDKAGIRYKGKWDFTVDKGYNTTPYCTQMSNEQVTEKDMNLYGRCKKDNLYPANKPFTLKRGESLGNAHFIMTLDSEGNWYFSTYDGLNTTLHDTGISEVSWQASKGETDEGTLTYIKNGEEHKSNSKIKALVFQSDRNLVGYQNYDSNTGQSIPLYASNTRKDNYIDKDYQCYWVRLAEMFTPTGACRLLENS